MSARDEEQQEYGVERTAAERLDALPPYLRFTPEQIAAAREENARKLAESNSPFLQLSTHDAARVRAIREEPDWRRSLAQLDFELACAGQAQTSEFAEVTEHHVKKYNDLLARRQLAAQTLAENLAAQGRFDEAARVTPSEAQAHEYVDLHEAVMRGDDEWCGAECDAAFENDPTRLTREDIVQEVFSVKHGKTMPANRCFYCKTLNVRPASRENLERRGARAKARALTEGQTPVRAAETLRREKLTSGDVFK